MQPSPGTEPSPARADAVAGGGAATGTATEAILLVGGLGTRLRPLTVYTPKPMLPVAGVPFLLHQLVKLRDCGVRHIVLATSYLPAVFTGYFGDGSDLGIVLDYVSEDDPLGTGGAIRNVADRLRSAPDDPVIVLNADILSGHDLAAQVGLHAARRADVTLHVTTVEDPTAFGCVPTDPNGRVTGFLEKIADPVTNQVNAGCYVFRRSVIDAIPPGVVVSVERETFPGLLASGALVMGYREDSYWLDLGTPAALVQGSRDLVLGRVASAATPPRSGDHLVLRGGSVDPGATVSGGSVIGAGARVEPGALVAGSVVQDGAVIRADSTVRDSVVGSGADVGDRTVVDCSVIGDGATVGADCELVGGVRVWVDATLSDRAVRASADG
jgi:mannose-1-phosphate guanylyltransferase